MLRLRLIFGTSIAAAVVALLMLDSWAAARVAEGWRGVGPTSSIWVGNGLICTILVLVFALLGVRELIAFGQRLGYRPLRFEAYFFSAGLVTGSWFSYNLQQVSFGYDESLGMLWLAIALAYMFCAQAVRRGAQQVFVNLASTLFILVYIGAMAGYLTKLRMEIGGWEGPVLLVFSILVVKITDTGAFFIGSLIGRTKLIPWLSPKKTWEGLIGGITVAVLTAIFVGAALRNYGVTALQSGFASTTAGMLTFGLAMAIFSVAGDLCASLLKRDAELKDSSDMIPGMGGVLDVIDSPLLAAPAAWFFWTRLAQL